MQNGIDPFSQFVGIIRDLLAPFSLEGLAIWVAIVPFLLIIYVIYLIVIRSLKISFRKMGAPREASTGLIFIVRLAFFGIVLVAILAATNVLLGGAALALSTLLGTAIGLAFSKAFSNVVAGLYVFGARPFRVGDYVKIGGEEGIVSEITLNYTRLLLPDFTVSFVPNSRVVDLGVTNFRIRIEDYLNERGREYTHSDQSTRGVGYTVNRLKSLAKGDEVYRHVFDVFVNINYDIRKTIATFDRLCDEWADEFIEKPEYFYYGNQNFGVIYRFGYILDDPKKILTVGSDFQTAVGESLMREVKG